MATVGMHRFTAPKVKALNEPGLYHDGAGLYLQVTAAREGDSPPNKSWLLKFTSPIGKRREMGLGPLDVVSLADARDAADRARKLLQAGVDPIEDRKRAKATARLEAAKAITFREAADTFLKSQTPSWKNPKHATLWANSMARYAYPTLGALAPADIDVGLVLKVLEPIWTKKPETAARIRQRVEAVLDWCAVRGYRSADNPARWSGHLKKGLPARPKGKAVKHHPALPFAEIGGFLGELRALEGLGARALELTILTAARTTETLGARWREFELDAAVWTIPAERMKADRPHRIPLSRQAVRLLRELEQLKSKPWVFPGLGTSKPLSGMSMLKTLERMKRDDITVHGFRSTFRDWAGETTSFPSEVAEAALAHAKGDKTEAAYRRGDALQKRRALMQAWADYCDRPKAKVVSIEEGKRERKGGRV